MDINVSGDEISDAFDSIDECAVALQRAVKNLEQRATLTLTNVDATTHVVRDTAAKFNTLIPYAKAVCIAVCTVCGVGVIALLTVIF